MGPIRLLSRARNLALRCSPSWTAEGAGDCVATNERALAVRRGADLTTHGAAESTETVTFGGDIVRWGHLPQALRTATDRHTAFVGECAVVDDVVDVLAGSPWRSAGVARLPGRAVRRDRGADRGAGALGSPPPLPPWREHRLETFEVRGFPDRRVGKVGAVIAAAGTAVRCAPPRPHR